MGAMRFAFALATVLACLSAASAQSKRGYGTAYSGPYEMDKTGGNACGFNPRSLPTRYQVYYAALNEADWNSNGGRGGVCGKCLAVRGVQGQTTPGHKIKTVYVKIVDLCPAWACPASQGHNVDFSTTALKAITGFDWDKKLITWQWTSCPVGDEDPEQEAKEKARAEAARAAEAEAEAKAKAEATARAEAARKAAEAERKAQAEAAARKAAAEKEAQAKADAQAAAQRAAARQAAAKKAAAAEAERERAAAARAQAQAEQAAAAREAAAKAAAAKAAAERAARARAAAARAAKARAAKARAAKAQAAAVERETELQKIAVDAATTLDTAAVAASAFDSVVVDQATQALDAAGALPSITFDALAALEAVQGSGMR